MNNKASAVKGYLTVTTKSCLLKLKNFTEKSYKTSLLTWVLWSRNSWWDFAIFIQKCEKNRIFCMPNVRSLSTLLIAIYSRVRQISHFWNIARCDIKSMNIARYLRYLRYSFHDFKPSVKVLLKYTWKGSFTISIS